MPGPDHDHGHPDHLVGGGTMSSTPQNSRSQPASPDADARPESVADATDRGHHLSARTVEALLDLLNENGDTDPDEVQRVLDNDAIDPAVGQSITTRVQRIRAHLSRAERRRNELAALFASSRELAEQREVGPLLRRLTRRAHDLLGADLTWLAEIDPGSGELVVKTTTGTVSSELEGVRVQPGLGMAWFVAAHRRAHSTTQYHVDPGFPHDDGADRALAAEGVVSALAVPLVTGEDVIGTLFVAVRHEAEFQVDQVTLLTAFADHAAVILQGARLLTQARDLADEAEDSRRQLSRHVAAMERAHANHAELTDCVLRGEDAVQVAATLGRAMKRHVMILDDERAPYGESHVGFPGEDSWRHPAVDGALTESRRTGRFVPISSPQVAGVVAVVAGGTFLGALLIAHDTSALGPVEHKTIEDAARIMALLRLKQDALADAEERVRGELLGDLVDSEAADLDELRRRARARGTNLDELRRIFVLSVDSGRRREAIRAVNSLAEGPALVAEHAGAVVMALGKSNPLDVRRIWERVRTRLDTEVLVVEAPTAATCCEVPVRYREARGCLALLPALGVTDAGTTTTPYSLYARLFEPNAQDIDDFVTATIGPLLHSDRSRGTDLLQTVNTFAECNASKTRTARSLHLHPNTVMQRLERVGKLLGEGWRDPDVFFRIQVAARIDRLRQNATSAER
ncbi:MAG: GAF domain-containing protein [Pseudonocardiaceae bacterium]|nr:GAF domain-containing protein [Pseudonocardiaceae bacterium]